MNESNIASEKPLNSSNFLPKRRPEVNIRLGEPGGLESEQAESCKGDKIDQSSLFETKAQSNIFGVASSSLTKSPEKPPPKKKKFSARERFANVKIDTLEEE